MIQQTGPRAQSARSSIIRASATLLLVAASGYTYGSGLADNYVVHGVRVGQDGKAYVLFETDLSDAPAQCTASANKKMLAFDTNTASGRAIMALALSVKASNLTMYARGTGTCSIFSTIEDWSWGKHY